MKKLNYKRLKNVLLFWLYSVCLISYIWIIISYGLNDCRILALGIFAPFFIFCSILVYGSLNNKVKKKVRITK